MNKKYFLSLSTLFLIGVFCLLPSKSYGFAELVRHGYNNCITCHYSPTGSGILNEYGRALSAEILSTWGTEKNAGFLHGAFKPPKPLVLGGDIRSLESMMFLNGNNRTRFILMQLDAEAGVDLGRFALIGTLGLGQNGLISRRDYALYRPIDGVSLRAGKFGPSFGINTENHSIGVRRGLGRDQATETYNVEAAWIGETFDTFLTGILGRPDDSSLGAEAGAAISSSFFLANRFKVGASYYYGSRDVESRQVAGPFGILGFTPHCFVLAEADFQFLSPKTVAGSATGTTGKQTGFVDYLRLDYEWVQGWHTYLTQEYSLMNFHSSSSGSEVYGVGTQWFPIPHLEGNLVYQHQRYGGPTASFGDQIYLMVHYYL